MIQYLCFAFVLAAVWADDGSRVKRASTVDINTFRSQNLNCHNNYRMKHQVRSLSSSSQLDAVAQNYAIKLANKDSANLKHSDTSYGENIYYNGGNIDGYTACKSWYAENQVYDYSKDNPSNSDKVGHFTQLVWKGSNEIGVGVATSRTGKTFVVANYSPPGNYKNEYRANVFPAA